MSENVFPLPGMGMDLYPPLESPYADNLAKFNKVVDAGYSTAALIFGALLFRSWLTLLDGWAPWPIQ